MPLEAVRSTPYYLATDAKRLGMLKRSRLSHAK